MKIFSGCIVVAATVDVVTDAHVVREGNLSRLVDITGEAGFPAALRTDGLAARTVFLEMESVFTHGPLILVWLHSALLHFEKIARYPGKMKVQ